MPHLHHIALWATDLDALCRFYSEHFAAQVVERGAERMGHTHLAISVGSEQAVDEVTERLRHAGVTVVSGPRRTGDGYYETVVLDPEGNRVEIAA